MKTNVAKARTNMIGCSASAKSPRTTTLFKGGSDRLAQIEKNIKLARHAFADNELQDENTKILNLLLGMTPEQKTIVSKFVSAFSESHNSTKSYSEAVLAVKALIASASPNERAQIASICRASVLPDYEKQLLVESKVKGRWKNKPSEFTGSASDFVWTYYKECIDLGILNLAMLRRIDEDLYNAYHNRISDHPREKIDIPTKNDVVQDDLKKRKINSIDDIKTKNIPAPETPASRREKERTRGMLRSMRI